MSLRCWILRRHDDLLQFEEDRLFLKCQGCGRETTGWQIGDPPVLTRWSISTPTSAAPRWIGIRGTGA